MQNITESEFQREVEALRSHRRISVHRPVLDPDLPEIGSGHAIPRDDLGNPYAMTSSSSLNNSGTPPSRGWNPASGVSLSDDAPSSSFTGTLARRNGSANARSTFTARRRGLNNASSKGSQEHASVGSPGSADGTNEDVSLTKPLDPSHLFWVPASVHPEISPSDFRKFLHDHASRAVREQEEAGESSPESSNGSVSPVSPTGNLAPHPVEALKQRSTSIARRGSTLRRQYRPEMDIESDSPGETVRRPSRTVAPRQDSRHGTPQLSIDDLQRLEQLAEEASKSSDPTELRSVLRRTMSLNLAPSALDQVDALPADSEQDAPLIVPKPGQILRRAARTKIRKSSISNDGVTTGSEGGGGGTGRRRRLGPGAGSTDDIDSTRYVETLSGEKPTSDRSEPSDEGMGSNVGSRSSLGAAQEADSRDSYTSDDTQRTSVTSLGESVVSGGLSARPKPNVETVDEPPTPTQDTISGKDAPLMKTAEPVGYFAHQGEVDRYHEQNRDHAGAGQALNHGDVANVDASSNAVASEYLFKPPAGMVILRSDELTSSFEKTRPAPQPPLDSPKPDTKQAGLPIPPRTAEQAGLPQRIARSDTMPNLNNQTPSVKSSKDRKGAFGLQWLSSWSKDDDSVEKLSKKERKERRDRDRDRDGPQTQAPPTSEKEKDTSGFLGSLFGKRKIHEDSPRSEYGINTQTAAAVTAGSLLDMHGKAAGDWAYYNRYPIHIERAVYRLSHIKLANPRRPLYEQVLISNLMFWYLSVINQTQQQQQQQQQQQHNQQQQIQTQQKRPQQQHHSQQQSKAYSIMEKDVDIRGEAGSLRAAPMQSSPSGGQASLSPAGSGESDEPAPLSSRADAKETNGADMPLSQYIGSKPTETQPPSHAEYSDVYDIAGTEMLSEHWADRDVLANGRQGGQQMLAASTIGRVGSPPLQKTKKSGLVKPNRAPPGTRSAERAIPAAAYGAQHRQINSEMAHSAAVAAIHSPESQSERTRVSPNLTSIRLTGRPGRHSSTSVNADEHAWLGSQRRSPNAEDRRSDPLSDTSAGRSATWRELDSARKGANRASDMPRSTVPNGDVPYSDDERRLAQAQGDGGVELADGWIRQALVEDGSATLPDGQGILMTNSKEASAMLDAARQSRSRRR